VLFGSLEPTTRVKNGTKRPQRAIVRRDNTSKYNRLREDHSLHTGGVAGSIPASPTIFRKWFQSLKRRPLPLPPLLNPEQNLKDAPKLGEISGSRFAIRSAHSQHDQSEAWQKFSPPSTRALSRLVPNPGIGVPPTEVTTPSTVTGIDLGFGGRKDVKGDG
jgi:hypothetical protein